MYICYSYVYRDDLEAECSWLYNDRKSASEEVKQIKLNKYRLLSSQGDSFGQFLLGFCYFRGWGVSEDTKRGAELYALSAKQGNAWGQYQLGLCYYNGYGVKKNRDLTRKWYKRAAAQGHEIAKCSLKAYFPLEPPVQAPPSQPLLKPPPRRPPPRPPPPRPPPSRPSDYSKPR